MIWALFFVSLVVLSYGLTRMGMEPNAELHRAIRLDSSGVRRRRKDTF